MMSGKGTLHNSRPVYNQMSARPICKREAITKTMLCYITKLKNVTILLKFGQH